MSDNIEIEAKILISEAQYNKAINIISDEIYHRFIQTNYYIDTKNFFLHNLGCSLRIRKKDNFELTLKAPLSEGLLEKSQIISSEAYKNFAKSKIFPDGDIKKFLMIIGINIDELSIITSLTTDRIELPYNDGTLCIDKNEYNEQVDYEIEMEHSSMENAQSVLKNFAEKLKIKDIAFNKISKQQRAMSTIKRV